MPVPGENYLLRLKETRPSLARMSVLDTCVIGVADTVTLIEWSYGTDAGFTLVRTDATGAVVWSRSRTLCTSAGAECGKYQIERGALARTPDGVIVAGAARLFGAAKPTNFAVRFRDDGTVIWVKRYQSIPTPPEELLPDFIEAITAMGAPDRYLVAANTESDTHLFQIDGAGNVVSAERWTETRVRRLRLTPTQILAVGECAILTNLMALVQSLDRMTGARAWLRGYWDRTPAAFLGYRWYDVAEGDTSLLVVGQHRNYVDETRPAMAFLDKSNGNLLKMLQPVLGDTPVRLRGVASHQDVVVPLRPGAATALFAVVGEAGTDPWSFVIDEDQTLQWQKRLRMLAGSTGKFNAVVWPSYDDIAGAGTTIGSTRAFVASSPYVIGRGKRTCSDETKLTFTSPFLEHYRIGISVDAVRIEASPFSNDQGAELTMSFQCLDVQAASP